MKYFVRNTIVMVGLIIIDQLLKFWFETKRLFVDIGIVSFHFVTNTGASFGILKGYNVLLAWISVIILGLIMLSIDKIKKEHTLPIILLVAGLLGNLIDRVLRGFVVDFIDLKFWPVFNLADSLVVIGVIWLGIVILRKDLKKPRRRLRRK
ncbi:signal peptidase II [Candidatus Woesearchaeota archaeon]|nr:signal peptidase II [Candidatus Woesearchaeota archaeon]